MNRNNVILDACMPTPKKIVEKLGFLSSYNKFNHSAPDEYIFDKATKDGQIIATRDSGFMLLALTKNVPIYFLGKNGHLYHVTGHADIVEPYFKYKFHDMITYYIHESDNIPLP